MPEPTKSMFGTDPAGSVDEPAKLRLGGMALRNGLLVHGPTHWSAAVRRKDGTIATASGRKPRLHGVEKLAGVRGVVRISEAMIVIPLVKRALPEAKLPFQDVKVLGEDGYELEFTEQVVGNQSPVSSPLMDAITAWIGEQDPGAHVVPTALPGFTDSRTFRDAFPECVAYGFFPQRHMTLNETLPLIHSADERIDVRDVGFATSFFRDITKEMLGD